MSAITSNLNLQALSAARTLDRTQDLLSRSLNRLSSGSKIADPADNAAGLASASRFDAQNLRVTAAQTNVQNAVSYVQSADAAATSLGNVVTRLGELATLAQDPTKNAADVANYQQEFQTLQDQLRASIGGSTAEIGGTADVTSPLANFNGVAQFGATATGGRTLTIGATAGETMTIPDVNLRTGAMASLMAQDASGQYLLHAADANATTQTTAGLQQLAAGRATLGAAQARLDLAATTLSVEGQNLTSAVSGLRDVDVAQESTQYAKYNILVQSGTAMLTQANQSPQAVLKLLKS